MKVGMFGLAKVFVEEDRDFGKPPKVEINWSCIGSVSIDRAREFIADMEKAVAFAVAEEERLGLREKCQQRPRSRGCSECNPCEREGKE